MKSIIAFVAIALIVVFVAPSQSVKVCTIRCNTTSYTNVCGKSGTICRRFSNACNQRLYNCINSQSYAKVALSRCRSIRVGSSGTCLAATSTTGTSVNNINSILNTLNGFYPSSGYVTPIVIRV